MMRCCEVDGEQEEIVFRWVRLERDEIAGEKLGEERLAR